MNSPASNTRDASPAPAAAAPVKPHYHRVLLKISGESFCKPNGFGIDGDELAAIAGQIAEASKLGTQLAVVVGGGNIVRGARLAEQGHIAQATADSMGMLGTAINGLALKESLESMGHPARVLSALNLTSIAENFVRGRAISHLEKGRIVIFVAGTGNPFFTTDTAAALRAAEIGAEVLLKATKVDGIYDSDPKLNPGAKRYDTLTYQEAINRNLKVMDLTAFSLCMERNIPIIIFNMRTPGNIAEVVSGVQHGTLVSNK